MITLLGWLDSNNIKTQGITLGFYYYVQNLRKIIKINDNNLILCYNHFKFIFIF
jgi:hypothetical protein